MRWYIHTTIYDILKHKYRLVLLPHICLSWGLPSLPIQAPIWSGFHVIYKMKRRQRTRTLQGVSQMDGKWCHPLRPLKTFPTKKLQCINIFWFIYGSHFIPWCFSKLSTHSCELLRLLVSSWGYFEFEGQKKIAHIGCFRYLQTWSALDHPDISHWHFALKVCGWWALEFIGFWMLRQMSSN